MADNKSSLSTDPYKGVRDFYPEDMFVQNYIFEVMRRVCESFGYLEYNASPLEPTDLYLGKTSEEIVGEQTYTFEDRGGRSVTLRPEMTPSVARMVAARKREMAFPARLYSIANMFRYERPQRGRVREHWQLNADIFGVPALDADAEIILVASSIMREFGATENDYEIRVNSRKLLNAAVAQAGLTDSADVRAYMRLLDAKDKMEESAFSEKYKEILAGRQDPLVLAETGDTEEIQTAREELTALLLKLEMLGIKNARASRTLVRGFDYYTGVTFEIFDTNPDNPRSLFGGGRYDNLLEAFGADHTPAVGFGMGDVTIRDFLATHDLLPEYVPSATLFIATTSPENIPEAIRLAGVLRSQDVPTAVNLLDRKVGDQIKAADKMKIPYLVCIGEREKDSKRYTVKTLATGAEKEVDEADLAAALWSEDVA